MSALADYFKRKQLRDARGRWRKGVSGNPRGRPRRDRDDADSIAFGEDKVEVLKKGRTTKISRRGANFELLWAAAKRGDVRAQVFLERKWHEADMKAAHLEALYEQMKHRLSEDRATSWDKRWFAIADSYFRWKAARRR